MSSAHFIAVYRRLPRAVLVVVALLAVAMVVSSPDGARGASSSTVVTMEVPSAISLTNNCQDPRGYQLGVVQPESSAITATGTGVCSLSWSSSNDTGMLRIAQRDGTGTAMARPGVGTPSAYDNTGMHSVDVYDATRVIAGGRARIRWSVDGGNTWGQQSSPAGSGAWLTDSEYVPGDPTRAFVGGTGSLIRVTGLPAPAFTDLFPSMTSGNPTNWPAAVQVNGVAAISASTILVVGSSGWVAKSTNANVATPSWTIFQLGTSDWYDIDAVDANTMYMVGDSGRAGYTTTGGGAPGAWTTGNAASGYNFRNLAIADATHIYGVTTYGGIFTCNVNPCTTGSWVNRTSIPVTTGEDLSGVGTSASLPNTAYAVSAHDGGLFKTSDGGVTWARQDSRVNMPVYDVDTSNGAHAVAVGSSRLSVVTNDGSSWAVSYEAPGITPLRDVDVAPVDGELLLGAGRGGLVRRSMDGGGSWSTIASGTTDSLFGVSFGTDVVAWAVGANGRIIRSTDGGLSWSTQTSGTPERLLSVQAVDDQAAWAVGDSGTVLRTTNGGATWATIAVTTTEHLRGVAALSAQNAWVVGEDGTIRVTSDGGSTWLTPSTTPSNWDRLHAVVAIDSQTAVATTDWLDVWRTTDGGVTWTDHYAGNSTWVSIDAAGPDTLYAGGSSGDWSVSYDGGLTWTFTQNGNPFHFGVAAIDETRAVFVGESSRTITFAPAAGASSQVADYGGAPNDWASSGASSLFGVCLQDVSAATTVAAGWTKDTTGGPQCTASDADPWRDVPVAATKIGTTALGGVGRVDLVWGMRPRADQAPANYSAMVVFEAVAPAV